MRTWETKNIHRILVEKPEGKCGFRDQHVVWRLIPVVRNSRVDCELYSSGIGQESAAVSC
jgi:hypothetical protein